VVYRGFETSIWAEIDSKVDYQRNKRGLLPRSSNLADVELDTEDEGVLAEMTIV
jgi:hypothetical protein